MNCNILNYQYSMVLSGGGALGIAHLGVLHDIEKKYRLPSEIVGTSMGGIIGAAISIGLNENEIYNILKRFKNINNWGHFSFKIIGDSLISTKKIENIFEDIFEDRKMCNTDIPLKLIVTNFIDGSLRVFDKNDDVYIKDALLATMAIPSIFPIKYIDNTPYCDGYIIENLGVRRATYNNILAIDVVGKNSFRHDINDINIVNSLERSIRLLMYNQTKNNIELLRKERENHNILLIEPVTYDFKTYQFHKLDELRKRGMNII